MATQGAVCWHEINTPNAEVARRFYSQLFGWQMTQTDMGGMQYTMLKHAGEDFGGIVPMVGPNWEGVPPHWMVYIAVDDVDASANRVVQLGGQVVVPPTDLPVGRFAMVTDPAGAAFSLYKSYEE